MGVRSNLLNKAKAVAPGLHNSFSSEKLLIMDHETVTENADACSPSIPVTIIDNDAELYFHLHQNEKREFALHNIHAMILYMDAEDEYVIVCLDGDDWLSNSKVLSYLNDFYNTQKCWLTYFYRQLPIRF